MKVTGCGGSGLSAGSRAEAFPAKGRGAAGGSEAAGSSSQALRARTPGECLTREGKGRRQCLPGLAAPSRRLPGWVKWLQGEAAPLGGEHQLLPWPLGNARGSPHERGGRNKSPRHEGRGGRAALHFQHSCSVLQRLVLAPLFLPYCFQKH